MALEIVGAGKGEFRMKNPRNNTIHRMAIASTVIAVVTVIPVAASASSSTSASEGGFQRNVNTVSRSAPATTYGCESYKYAGNETASASYEGVYGYVDAEGLSYGGTPTNHEVAWIGSNTPSGVDSQEPASGGMDWVQGGFGVGDVDALVLLAPVVYSEATGPGYDGVLDTYPQDGLGNQFFESIMTTTTNGSYGLYYMFDGTTEIGDSYLIDPASTEQEALAESYGSSAVAACPSITDGLFGTTGSDDSYNSSTELNVLESNSVPYLWDSSISTGLAEDPPYQANYWADYSAFQAYGS